MPLYDVRCKHCGLYMEDQYAVSAKKLSAKCPSCGRKMVCNPYVRTQSTKSPWECQQAGESFHAYSDLERWARKNGKAIVPAKEFERRHVRRTTEERFNAVDHSALKETIK